MSRTRNAARQGARGAGVAASRIVLVIAVAFSLFPIVWLILTSLKLPRDIFTTHPRLIFPPTLANYRYDFHQNQMGLFLINSLTIGLAATAASLLLGSVAAYGFQRLPVRGGRLLFFGVLAMRMVPTIALIVPIFLMLKSVGLLDTRLGIVLVYTAMDLPLVMWMMRGFIAELPWDLEDSARIDGCSRLGAFFRIILPISRAGLASVAVFTFIANWNEFLLALVLTSTARPRTMPVALAAFNTEFGVRWDYLSAAGVVLILPTIIFTFLLQKYIVSGLTFGAVKE